MPPYPDVSTAAKCPCGPVQTDPCELFNADSTEKYSHVFSTAKGPRLITAAGLTGDCTIQLERVYLEAVAGVNTITHTEIVYAVNGVAWELSAQLNELLVVAPGTYRLVLCPVDCVGDVFVRCEEVSPALCACFDWVGSLVGQPKTNASDVCVVAPIAGPGAGAANTQAYLDALNAACIAKDLRLTALETALSSFAVVDTGDTHTFYINGAVVGTTNDEDTYATAATDPVSGDKTFTLADGSLCVFPASAFTAHTDDTDTRIRPCTPPTTTNADGSTTHCFEVYDVTTGNVVAGPPITVTTSTGSTTYIGDSTTTPPVGSEIWIQCDQGKVLYWCDPNWVSYDNTARVDALEAAADSDALLATAAGVDTFGNTYLTGDELLELDGGKTVKLPKRFKIFPQGTAMATVLQHANASVRQVLVKNGTFAIPSPTFVGQCLRIHWVSGGPLDEMTVTGVLRGSLRRANHRWDDTYGSALVRDGEIWEMVAHSSGDWDVQASNANQFSGVGWRENEDGTTEMWGSTVLGDVPGVVDAINLPVAITNFGLALDVQITDVMGAGTEVVGDALAAQFMDQFDATFAHIWGADTATEIGISWGASSVTPTYIVSRVHWYISDAVIDYAAI